jgi:hypothetical protein
MYRMGWSDERLDDFAKHVDERFDRLELDVRDPRDDVNSRFEGLQRTLLLTGVASSPR